MEIKKLTNEALTYCLRVRFCSMWNQYGVIHFLCPVPQALAHLYSDEHWLCTFSACLNVEIRSIKTRSVYL